MSNRMMTHEEGVAYLALLQAYQMSGGQQICAQNLRPCHTEPAMRPTMAESAVEGGLWTLMPPLLVATSVGALKLLGVWRGIDSTLALAQGMGCGQLLQPTLGQAREREREREMVHRNFP